MSITTLGEFLNLAEKAFLEAELYFGHGTDNAWDEAVMLARYVLKLPFDVDYSVIDRPLTKEELQELMVLMQKRIRDRIPVPYLTGEAWFAGLKFYVDERVLIPRSPLGEFIENRFEPWVFEQPVKRILDLCTGSGSIAIACAYAFPSAEIDAVDISLPALEVAKKNVADHQLQDRLHLLQGDLFAVCSGRQYDIIISNPPYVDRQDFEDLPREYHAEPELALSAGEDGLKIVARILQEAAHYLTPEGLLIVEVGNSEEALAEKYPQLPFTWLEFAKGGQGVFLLTKMELETGEK
jgi:ribosomal protein L3 glutamine methyltransferase